MPFIYSLNEPYINLCYTNPMYICTIEFLVFSGVTAFLGGLVFRGFGLVFGVCGLGFCVLGFFLA